MSNHTDAAQALKNLAQNLPKPVRQTPKSNTPIQNPKSLTTATGQRIKLNDPPTSTTIK